MGIGEEEFTTTTEELLRLSRAAVDDLRAEIEDRKRATRVSIRLLQGDKSRLERELAEARRREGA